MSLEDLIPLIGIPVGIVIGLLWWDQIVDRIAPLMDRIFGGRR